MNYIDCWINVAATLLSQALVGEPELVESLPKPFSAGSFGFAATLTGDVTGRFSVVLDSDVLESSLLGEGADQKAVWEEILREVADSAAGELLARSGVKCRVQSFESIESEAKVTRAFQLQSADRAWTLLVRDEVKASQAEAGESTSATKNQGASFSGASPQPAAEVSPGIELLLDVELEATLRFGCREMPLGEILDLGPGDVVQLDRHVSDPVDLIVGDKIVARGEVVLVNGNFGLRVSEVAAPRRRLESIRCLF